MIVIIAGGRNYQFTQDDLIWLDEFHKLNHVAGVVVGGAPGADTWGQRWAEDLNIPVKVMKPDWQKWGTSAGPMRNKNMAAFINQYHRKAVILFPGGRGTDSMRREAERLGIPVVKPNT